MYSSFGVMMIALAVMVHTVIVIAATQAARSRGVSKRGYVAIVVSQLLLALALVFFEEPLPVRKAVSFDPEFKQQAPIDI
jgi:hypothetical protein